MKYLVSMVISAKLECMQFLVLQKILLYRGDTKETRGTAFVVYEDIYDAKDAVEHLSGFNVGGRYLVVLYFQATKYIQSLNTFYNRDNKTADPEKREKEIEELKAKYGLAK